MSSIKGDIYTALKDHLKNEITGLNWIDKYKGQLEYIEVGSEFVTFPAVFISFATSQWQTSGGGVQKSQTVISIITAYENYADSFDGSENEDEALLFWEFNEAVHKALQGFKGDCFTALERIGDQEDEDHTNVIATRFTYATEITDDSGARLNKYVIRPEIQDINVDHNADLATE